MLNDVFIVDNGEATLEDANLDGGFMQLHVVDLNDIAKLLDLIKYYYQNKVSQKFGIALKNVSATNTDALFDAMVLLAHPNHLGSSASMKVFLLDAFNESKKIVETFLIRQGYQESKVMLLASEYVTEKNYFSLYSNQDCLLHCTSRSDFYQHYHSYLERSFEPDAFLVVKEKLQVQDTYSFLLEVLNAYKKSNPYLFSLLSQLHKFEKENQHLRCLATLRESQLKNFQKLFEENAKNSEIDYILNFYHKEYEVLPLWFKRLGHIVKAATGKRSWSSLTGSNES